MRADLRLVELLRFVVVFALGWAAFSTASSAHANPKYAAFVIHADSGDVLFDRYSAQRRHPASLTKMMTLYLLFEEIEAGTLKLDSNLAVSAQASGQPPSKLGLETGKTISAETAIQALVVRSANDVAVVVAEAISGTEWRFAQKMTEKARALGMRNTVFRNASGLPNTQQVTTARDLAVLSQRLIQDFPQYYHYFSTDKFEWNGRTYRSHNAVARTYRGAEGLKTGYTRMSGFNLATSATRDGQRLVGIVLGGRSVKTRDDHMREILDGAFAAIDKKPALIASLHRETPTPRLKPTLAMAASANDAPTVAGNAALKDEIRIAAAALSPLDDAPDALDAIGALIATHSDDLNQFQRARLASLVLDEEGVIGEGDAEQIQETGFSVQIGAYSTKELARRELESAAAVGAWDDRARIVQPAPGARGGNLYRARFISLSANEANEICATLKARNRNCFVVSNASQ
jgi:D-alanyl-D-alanine carboxypeptidase